MLELSKVIKLLHNMENIDTRNSRPKSAKGFQLRTILLLCLIMEEEGENQAYYKEIFGWSVSSISVNTRTLLDYGFIIAGDDERDPRGSSKRLYLAEGVREYLTKLLELKE